MALRTVTVTPSTIEQTDGAFDRLFIGEYRRVVAIAFRILNDSGEAEDVAQEAFVSFHRRYDASSPFAAAWLHRAASHLALNAIRSRKRRSRREEADAINHSRVHDTQAIAMDPSHGVELTEQRMMVRNVLSRLSKRNAEVLALRYSGLSYAETAAALGCKVGNVGTMLKRAEEAFRKELNHEAHR